jgi:type II secretory pathway pseudopilin PulG
MRRQLRRASVLLEVLLALVLFGAAAAVVTTAFNSSMASLDRQKLGFLALNLASSVVAEVQLGIRSTESESPQPLDPPFEDWTYQTVVTPMESAAEGAAALTRLEVIVRHQKSATVHRLAQVISPQEGATTNSLGSPSEF